MGFVNKNGGVMIFVTERNEQHKTGRERSAPFLYCAQWLFPKRAHIHYTNMARSSTPSCRHPEAVCFQSRRGAVAAAFLPWGESISQNNPIHEILKPGDVFRGGLLLLLCMAWRYRQYAAYCGVGARPVGGLREPLGPSKSELLPKCDLFKTHSVMFLLQPSSLRL